MKRVRQAIVVEGKHDVIRVHSAVEALVIPTDGRNLYNLSTKTIKITAKYLMDLEEDNASYAVRVINIPVEKADTTIYARPYFVYEDAEGKQIVVYDDIFSATYNG